jgi:hypothetical protein
VREKTKRHNNIENEYELRVETKDKEKKSFFGEGKARQSRV